MLDRTISPFDPVIKLFPKLDRPFIDKTHLIALLFQEKTYEYISYFSYTDTHFTVTTM